MEDKEKIYRLYLLSFRSQALSALNRRETKGGQHVGPMKWDNVPLSVLLDILRDCNHAMGLEANNRDYLED